MGYDSMKKLGLVGGMGPESTLMYYRDIVYGVQKSIGRFPELTIESVDVSKILEYCQEREYDHLTDYLLQAIQNLAAAGADFAALSANTPHIVFDQVQSRSPLPLVSILESTCAEAKRCDVSKAGLLGTVFTMEGMFYRAPFVRDGIEIAVPTPDERELVNRRIADELEVGIVSDETRAEFMGIIERMKREENIQAVILGCTELPLLFNGFEAPVKCLDTMQIHIRTLVDMILGE